MRVNGEAYPHRGGLTLHALLAELDIDQRVVVVMHREDIYPAGRIPDAPLEESDELEIVTMMQEGSVPHNNSNNNGNGSSADPLVIAGRTFSSRLMLGTGKYKDFGVMREALAASGTQIVTVSIRRVEIGAPGHGGILDAIDLDAYQLLPNTAGCKTSAEALRVARLARAMTGTDWVKLEVIPDAKYLLPDPVETLRAAEILIGEGFIVLPYMPPDPVLARRLAEAGCATVMPLASPIGSGRGVLTQASIEIIIEESAVPVVVDAGLGVPSEAAHVMELGAHAVLVNTAIAESRDPVQMATAFRGGVDAGRRAYLAGRMPVRAHASPSSPVSGVVTLAQPEVPA